MKNIQFGVIGCGGRLRGLAATLNGYESVMLKGVWDPSHADAEQLLQQCTKDNQGIIYNSYEEMLSDEEIEWVMIGSPNAFHAEQIIAAFKAGKHVFSEKPIAISIEELLAIKEAHEASHKLFATGFTLRYATIYREAKKILESKALGDIISVNGSENILPDHGSYIMKNWRRLKELSGPHILEKCVHDMDLLNWLIASVPTHISAFGGNKMFVPANSHLYDQHPNLFNGWDTGMAEDYEQGCDNPFLSDKTIEDNVVAIMRFANNVQVQFQATTSNAIPERRLYFSCTEGTLIVELYSGKLIYKRLGDEAITEVDLVGGGHGDGDYYIIKELMESMVDGKAPVCSGEEGIRSAVVALGIEQARLDGQVLDLTPIWKQFGVNL
ncbi:MAG: Gfo/Idh/MocA family oxidoreductase [Niameybacter sp.]|uniref:Gfo/Idh/MocA family protein n=1 Tax=Niameybacter sp. TaxID=2033640 RepID=UPI002FC71269